MGASNSDLAHRAAAETFTQTVALAARGLHRPDWRARALGAGRHGRVTVPHAEAIGAMAALEAAWTVAAEAATAGIAGGDAEASAVMALCQHLADYAMGARVSVAATPWGLPGKALAAGHLASMARPAMEHRQRIVLYVLAVLEGLPDTFDPWRMRGELLAYLLTVKQGLAATRRISRKPEETPCPTS